MLHFRKILLVSVIAFSLAACASGPDSGSSTPTTSTSETSSSSTPTTSIASTSPTPASTSPSASANPNTANKKFAQKIQLVKPLKSGKVSETIKVPVTVENTSNFAWDSGSANPVNFSYNWFDSSGNRVVFNGDRTPLPKVLAPQSSEKLNAVIKFPDRPGKYNLVLTMVQEGVTWFNDAGAQAPKIPVTVTR